MDKNTITLRKLWRSKFRWLGRQPKRWGRSPEVEEGRKEQRRNPKKSPSLLCVIMFSIGIQENKTESTFHVLSTQRNYSLFTLVAQMVKNLPAIQETQVQSLDREIPWKGNGNPLQYSCLENPMDRGACSWGCKGSEMNEWLTHTHIYNSK